MGAKHSREDGGEDRRRLIEPNRHEHPLQWSERLPLYKCRGCKEKGVNVGYRCSNHSCHSGKVSTFHEDCATPPDEKQHPIQDRTFSFRKYVKFWKLCLPHRCTACDHKLKGFLYKTENRDMRLHPLCLTLPREFAYNGQSFRLMIGKWDEYKCCYCKETIKHGWKYAPTDFDKEFCMDVSCAKDHIHGLSARGIHSSRVRRKRDHLKDFVERAAGCVGTAAGVAAVVSSFVGG